jgi:type VI secretion system protein ImpG
MIEAMAMFTARTRVAAERSVRESMFRLFRQHFANVLAPVPAMALVRASPSARYVEVTELPRGTELAVVERRGAGAPDRVARFQTTAKLRILPIELTSVDIFTVRTKGFRIVLRFETPFARSEDIGDLSLQVSHLDDLRSSMTVLHTLRAHLRGTSVVFDKKVVDDTQGTPVDARFGAPELLPEELEPFDHALERARSFYRFPQQELFLTLKGIKSPRNWQSFTVILDVGEAWPRELRLTRDTFRLHVVPMANLRREMANPIECDGTREKWLVRHPDPAGDYVPHSVLGVFLMTDKGLVPLEPAVLGARKNSYDVLMEGEDEERRAFVALNLPSAFDKPERVAVDAYWHQPALWNETMGKVEIRPSDRHVEGVEWALSGPIVPHGSSTLGDDKEKLLHLLSIKSQRFLGVDDLVFLLRALGADEGPSFEKLVFAIDDVTVEAKPFARRSNAFKYTYKIRMGELEPTEVARLSLFAEELLSLLSAWSVEEVVELHVSVPNLARELTFPLSKATDIMPSATALWFPIEATFAEIEDLCVAARAAQLVVEQKRDEATMLKTFGRPRPRDDDEPEARTSDPRLARAAVLAKDLAFREANPDGPDLVEVRARLRKRIVWLKSKLAEVLTDHEVYSALFPIVVYVDELVQSVTRGEINRWEPLQSELYNVDNGGELFYSILEDRLRQEETPQVVFEVFYFCLNDGFSGMYVGDTRKIDEYKTRLAEKIPLRPTGNTEAYAPIGVELVSFPWQYYAGSAAVLLTTFAVLSWLGSTS